MAVGGGSAIDTAKAVSIVLENGGKVEDYEGTDKSQRKGVTVHMPSFLSPLYQSHPGRLWEDNP